MGRELILFAKAIWYGALLFAVYDCLRIWRNVVPHSQGVITMEDLLYWTGSSLFLFSRFFRENSGALRAYLFMGTGAGALAWYLSFSSYFVNGLSRVFCKLCEKGKIPVRKLLILSKRLKFWLKRCNIILYERVSPRRKPSDDRNMGVKNGKKERKKKEHKGKTGDRTE